jgi:hypothetical protein
MRQSIQVPTDSLRCSRPLRARPTIGDGGHRRPATYPRVSRQRHASHEGYPHRSHVRRVVRAAFGALAARDCIRGAGDRAGSGARERGREGPTKSRRGQHEIAFVAEGRGWQGASRARKRAHLKERERRAQGATPPSSFLRDSRTQKRPKEPRVRSLRCRCKHLQRHFRSRGPFGQDLL